jgi:hypothetical protein
MRSQFSHGSEVWAPQGPSSDLLRLESVQRRATKVILHARLRVVLLGSLKEIKLDSYLILAGNKGHCVLL